MKYLIFTLLISTNVFAGDPNFDTSTGIVYFPRVTVNNENAYNNVQLLLDSNGTWDILSATPEPPAQEEKTLTINGSWSGSATSESYSGCNAVISGVLSQNGNELTGLGRLDGNCLAGGEGTVVGFIDGNNITFGLAVDDNTNISFSGVISDNYENINGTYIWPAYSDQGKWSLILSTSLAYPIACGKPLGTVVGTGVDFCEPLGTVVEIYNP